MTLKLISYDSTPTYLALSTDINVDNKILGASNIGKTILLTDTGEWKIILSDSTLGDYSLSISGEMEISDGANLDAFSRLRISNPTTIFNSTFIHDLQPILYEQIVATGGSVSHDANRSSAAMTVNTLNGASIALQSRQYHQYSPAKSQMIVATQVFGAPVANVRKRVGYFDAANGIFLEQNGTVDVAFAIRSSVSGSPVSNRVAQSNWNLDKLDGTGKSGITLDLSKSSIMIIDLQWLGMGRVRVGFDIGGKIIYVHQFLHANILSTAYMQTANLPVRWEMTNTGVSAGATMYAACCAVTSEGGDTSSQLYHFTAYNSADINVGTSRVPLLAIRPKATFNGIVNRIEIIPGDFSVLAGNNPILVELIYNPTLAVTGGWTSADSNSAVEYHSVITSLTGGMVVESFFVGSSNVSRGSTGSTIKGRLPLALNAAGTNPIPLVVCATATNTTSACRGRIEWQEIR